MENAVTSYDIAAQIARINMPAGHPLIGTIEDSLKKARGKLNYSKTTHIMRNLIRNEKAVKHIMYKEQPKANALDKRDLSNDNEQEKQKSVPKPPRRPQHIRVKSVRDNARLNIMKEMARQFPSSTQMKYFRQS
jgi:hypothetical protein